jgi:hypothetical protein
MARTVVQDLDIDFLPYHVSTVACSEGQQCEIHAERVVQSGEPQPASGGQWCWCQQQGIIVGDHPGASREIQRSNSCLRRSANTGSRVSYLGEFKCGYSRSMTTYAVEQLRNYVHTIRSEA